MDHGQLFVLAIVAISICGGVGKAWVRANGSHPPEGRMRRRMRRMTGPFGALPTMRGLDWGPDEDDIAADRKIALLTAENDKLSGRIGRLEERIAVLERIATDPAERTARAIDALRD